MKFNEAVENIMPLVSDGDKSTPFIISKQNGEWAVYCPYPAEKTRELLKNVRKSDPYADAYCGADFSKGSYPFVYDEIFVKRLYAEYRADENISQVNAIVNCLEDSRGELSQEAIDYILSLDNPLAEISEFCPPGLQNNSFDYGYDVYEAQELINMIERKAQEAHKNISQENDSISALSKDGLLNLLNEYDRYIQNANDENRYQDSWFPVCIGEFYDNEYQQILGERAENQAQKKPPETKREQKAKSMIGELNEKKEQIKSQDKKTPAKKKETEID